MNVLSAIRQGAWFPALLLPFTGCALFNPPTPCISNSQVAIPGEWKESRSGNLATAIPRVEQWWKLFHDDELTRLIECALKREPDIRRACARVKEVHAMTNAARAKSVPRVDLVPGYQLTRVAKTDSPFGVSPAVIREDTFSRYQLPFQVSYSLDLFNRMQRRQDALRIDEEAAICDLEAAALLISGEVARVYFLYQALRADVHLLIEALEDRRQAIEIQQSLVDAGRVNEQDLALTRLEEATLEVELASSRGELKVAGHALARLTGEAPACFRLPRPHSLPNPPRIPEGVPADLLCRRPDIAAARKRIESALNKVEVAQLAFLPVIDLTAAGGLASVDLSRLISAQGLAWTLGASLTQTLIDGGFRKETVKVLLARHERKVAEYDKIVLDALREVEDALVEIEAIDAKLSAAWKAEQAARQLADIAEAQFDRGLTNYLNVIDAERSLLEISRQRNQLRKSLNIATIQLIVALGGGC